MRTVGLISVLSIIGVIAACAPAAAPTPSPAPTPTNAPSPTASPTHASTPTTQPTDTPELASPALIETFTSDIHGMSVSYPSGWHEQRATEPWNGDLVQQNSPFADVIYEKETDSPFIALASQALAGQAFDDWADDYVSKLIADEASCADSRDPITVDGAAGFLAEPCFVALVSDGQRGYLIWFYRVDDREWMDAVLATVLLEPAEAVEVTPSP